MQLGTYADWRDVSRQMASHYDVAGTVGSGALADEIARIAGASDDPLERAAMALRVVQDEISYLSNGLDGGNYLPQMPQETWEKRYGDCKAKSVLLLAMLRELEVPSEVVLVQSKGGDILPDLAPIPGNFDHMIVRAEIAGQSYWLDGTGSGTRADTIDTIPRFHYALPLRNEGASLMALGSRPQSTPDRIVRISLDQRAGVILPALVDVEVEFRIELITPQHAHACPSIAQHQQKIVILRPNTQGRVKNVDGTRDFLLRSMGFYQSMVMSAFA